MGLAVRPFSAFIIGSLRDPAMTIDFHRLSLVGSSNKEPGGGFLRRRPTLPQSDFDASSGFHSLSTLCSFRCIPNVFQSGRTRGVRALQRFLLSGCRHLTELPLSPTSSFEVVCPFRLVSRRRAFSSLDDGLSCWTAVPRILDPMTLSRLPLSRSSTPLGIRVARHFPSFEGLAACFARLQGFELPERTFCHVPV